MSAEAVRPQRSAGIGTQDVRRTAWRRVPPPRGRQAGATGRAGDSARPPGPRGLPLVGALPWFTGRPLEFLPAVARRYGDAATIPLPRGRALFLFSAPSAVGHVLVEHADGFTSREVNLPSMPFLGDGLLNIDGEPHRTQRALVQPHLQRRPLEACAADMVALAEERASAWRPGAIVDLAAEMRRLALEVAARTLLHGGAGLAAGDLARDFSRLAVQRRRGLIPLPALDLPFTAHGKAQRARRRVEARVQGLLAARRAAGRGPGDVLDALLAAEAAGRISAAQVRDHTVTLLAAGHETTASALAFALHLLGRHPAAAARVASELRAVLGHRAPGPADLPRLPYLDAVVRETLRLYPPAWIVGRRAAADYALLGYRFAAGSFCVLSQWVVHRRPDLWPRAREFVPERWLPEGRQGRPASPYAYFPFGAGPRSCVGMGFALQEAKLVLAVVLRRWRVQPLGAGEPALTAAVTLRPRGGMPVRLHPA